MFFAPALNTMRAQQGDASGLRRNAASQPSTAAEITASSFSREKAQPAAPDPAYSAKK
jgi:hypothetical protein